MSKRINIKDVAKEAGVSIATVSYVVNNKKGIKVLPETELKVMNAIKKLGYVPNLSGRMLANNKSNMIGIVIPQTENKQEFMFHNPFYSEFLSSFEYTARIAGYHVLISGTNADEQYIEIAHKRNLDGIVILGAYPKDDLKLLEKTDIPMVLVDTYVESNNNFQSIGTDDEKGAYAATNYLLTKGHKKIAMITGDVKQYGVNKKRLFGYNCAMQEAGIDIQENWVILESVGFEAGINSAPEIQKLMIEDGISAVFCTADIIAVGLIKGLQQLNINVPGDISVMGFDDTYLAKVSTPSLTTVAQNISIKGKRSAELIIEMINGNNKAGEVHLIPTKLVVRDSVREVLE